MAERVAEAVSVSTHAMKAHKARNRQVAQAMPGDEDTSQRPTPTQTIPSQTGVRTGVKSPTLSIRHLPFQYRRA